jgi:hypothetical protein
VTVFVCGAAVFVVVEVVGAAAVVVDGVCAAAVAVWVWEGWDSVAACVPVGVLLLVVAVVSSVRLETV